VPDDSDPIEQTADAAPEPGSLDDLLADLSADDGEAEPQLEQEDLESAAVGDDARVETFAEPANDAAPTEVPEPESDAGSDEQASDDQPAEDEPGTTGALPVAQADAELAEGVGSGLTWIPYAGYLAAWLLLAGASAYLLRDATPESPARWTPEYAVIVWTGVGLTALGPLLSLVVWLVARSRRPASARRGLFVSALIRGALTAVFGVLIWAATIYVLELVATGVLS